MVGCVVRRARGAALWFWALVVACVVGVAAALVPNAAAGFYPEADILDCNVIPAVGVFINKLPNQGKDGIFYDMGLVQGEWDTVVGSTNLKDYVDTHLGRARRLGRATYVALPPGATLSFAYWLYSFAPGPVPVYGLLMPVMSYDGDIRKILEIPGPFVPFVSFKYAGHVYTRDGAFYEFDFNKTVYPKVLDKGGVFLKSRLKAPVRVKSVSKEFQLNQDNTVTAFIRLCLKNDSDIRQDFNVEYNSRQLVDRQIAPFGELCTDLSITSGFLNNESFDFGSLTLGVLSTQTECISTGDYRGDSTNPYSRAVFIKRGSSSAPVFWYGLQPSLARVADRGICVSRIPYNVRIPLGVFKPLTFIPQLFLNVQPGCLSIADRTTFAVTLVNNTIKQNNVAVFIKPVGVPYNVLNSLSSNVQVTDVGYRVNVGGIEALSSKSFAFEIKLDPNALDSDLPLEFIFDIIVGESIKRIKVPRCDGSSTPKLDVVVDCTDLGADLGYSGPHAYYLEITGANTALDNIIVVLNNSVLDNKVRGVGYARYILPENLGDLLNIKIKTGCVSKIKEVRLLDFNKGLIIKYDKWQNKCACANDNAVTQNILDSFVVENVPKQVDIPKPVTTITSIGVNNMDLPLDLLGAVKGKDSKDNNMFYFDTNDQQNLLKSEVAQNILTQKELVKNKANVLNKHNIVWVMVGFITFLLFFEKVQKELRQNFQDKLPGVESSKIRYKPGSHEQ